MSKTSSASKMKYDAKAYDRITFRVPKGKKIILNEHAKTKGESLNAFINRAVGNQIENDNKT